MNYSFLAERNLCSNANANAFAQNNQLNGSYYLCAKSEKWVNVYKIFGGYRWMPCH